MIINEDIIRDLKSDDKENLDPNGDKYIYLTYEEKDHQCNSWIKDFLQEEQDYKIVNKPLWEFFIGLYPNFHQVKRMAYKRDNGEKFTEIKLKEVIF